MRTEVIKADSIAEAAERILDELKEDDTSRNSSTRNNVIYFDGWDGLGASAVLRAVAQRLTAAMASSDDEAPAGLQFDPIIHVNCSKWESRRSLQRAIAEQMKLPSTVMDMFDRQDEEDDFHGIAEGSRTEIPQVVKKMYEHVQKLNHKCLVIFHNGSDEDIDLATICGFPLSGFSTNKVLWTFQGAFRLKPRIKVDEALKRTGTTDVFLQALGHKKDPQELWNYLAHQDAAEVARRLTITRAAAAAAETSATQTISTYYVARYFLYMWKLCGMVQHFRMDYDMATHGVNYWVCDGAIQPEQSEADIGNDYYDDDDDGEGPWRAAAAVQHDIRLDSDYYHHHSMQSLPSHLMRCADSTASTPYWTSPPHGVLFFSTGDTLQHFSKIGVLKLSRCTFSFSSPPFVCCSSLRFLWLDHCQDQVIRTDEDGKEENIHHCFKRLWVLDVRYTRCDQILSAQMLDFLTELRELNVIGAQDWDISQLQGRLPNIRKLRVTKSIVGSSDLSKQDLFSGMNKMELLDFSGNCTMQGVTEFFKISTSNSCIETLVIIEGCVGIQKFSLRGYAELKNLLLSGLFEDLRILDLSGTAVKTLDLSAMTAHELDEIILDNCDKLCAILWPTEGKRKSHLQKMHIDTTWPAASSSSTPMKENSTEGSTTASVTTSSSAPLSVAHGGKEPSAFAWCIRLRDARLLTSLGPFKEYFATETLVHVEIYSPPTAFSSGNNNKAASSNSSIKHQQHVLVKVDKPTDSFEYADVDVTLKDHPFLQPSEGDAPMLTQIWPCPSIPSLGDLNCYTHIQDHQLSTKSLPEGEQTMSSIVIPDMICHNVGVLHVHDSLSITSIPGPAPALGSTWFYLNWCRIERCPKLEHVFTTPQLQARADAVVVFNWLQTLWASELPKAHYIWNWAPPPMFQFDQESFEDLRLLHVDLCPRLIHVLPLAVKMVKHSLGSLETIEIVWCGDLREVFPLYTTDAKSEQQQSTTTTMHFQRLKHIHLHELPKLQGICGQWRISAPELETVKIRGCWSLKRLPAVSNNSNMKVECDCEKEWWDVLEWDGLDANHHPSLYQVTHSRYYKKTLLRGSVLR